MCFYLQLYGRYNVMIFSLPWFRLFFFGECISYAGKICYICDFPRFALRRDAFSACRSGHGMCR